MKRSLFFAGTRVWVQSVIEPDRADGQLVPKADTDAVSHGAGGFEDGVVDVSCIDQFCFRNSVGETPWLCFTSLEKWN